jgi:chorismate mutase
MGEAVDTATQAAVTRAIDGLRDAIDRVDERLVQLLNERAGYALEIGRLKRLVSMEIYQPAREEAVLRHVRATNPGPLDGDAMVRLFERIIDEARRLERVMSEEPLQPEGEDGAKSGSRLTTRQGD